MRWSENETYYFVKLYLSHEYLWNCDHTDYRLKNKRLKAYREIVSVFSDMTGIVLNEAEVRIKIKNLRSTYSQEITKIKQRSGPEGPYKSNLKWFGEWHKCFSKRCADKPPIDSSQDVAEDHCEKTWLNVEDEVEDDTFEAPFPSAEEDFSIILKTEPRDIVHVTSNTLHTQYEHKKQKLKRRSPSPDCPSPSFRSTDSNNESMAKDDEFDIYGKYIASQLRKMDLQKALRLQLAIQSLVSEARISDLNGKC